VVFGGVPNPLKSQGQIVSKYSEFTAAKQNVAELAMGTAPISALAKAKAVKGCGDLACAKMKDAGYTKVRDLIAVRTGVDQYNEVKVAELVAATGKSRGKVVEWILAVVNMFQPDQLDDEGEVDGGGEGDEREADVIAAPVAVAPADVAPAAVAPAAAANIG
jgi:hypothetical protein